MLMNLLSLCHSILKAQENKDNCMDSNQKYIGFIVRIKIPPFIFTSLLVHVFGLYLLFSNSHLPSIQDKKNKKILAYLYHHNIDKTHKSLSSIRVKTELKNGKDRLIKSIPKSEPSKFKSQQNEKVEQKPTKAVVPTQINTADLLNNLATANIQNIEKSSALTSYNEFQQKKHFIPRSRNKFNQLPQPKAQKIAIKCNNTFTQGLTILSGLMGGTIQCEKFSNSQKYIDKRLKRMGKK